MYINTITLQYPVTYEQILSEDTLTSFPPPPFFVPPEPYLEVMDTEKPVYNKITQQVVEIKPVFIDDVPYQAWSVIEIFSNEEDRQNATIQATEAANNNRIAAIWKAAHDKEYDALSGSAIGLVTIGVIQNKPKCKNVFNWIQSIWAEYYARKVNGSIDIDLSFLGDCPHSVPEIMEEMSQ